jgi:small subunit ribosomal protein S1
MSALLDEAFDVGIPVAGELRSGYVVASRNSDVLVDIGAKSEAVISGAELAKLDQEARDELTEGTKVKVFIVNPENKDGEIVVSYAKALEERDWELAAELLESQDVYEGRVIGFNRGGLLTRIGRVRGFVPSSQLTISRQLRNADDSDEMMQKYVGKRIKAKVIEVDRSRNRLILSERAANKEVREAKRAELLEELNEGDVIDGQVVNLADFGAFVDIGGMEGLVHISEMSWKRTSRPSDLFSVGDEVKVYVLNIDSERQRVALSTKRLEPDPWTKIDERYQVGQLVPVSVTKLADYGAFARLDDDEYDFEGLIHVSELSEDHVKHPNQLLRKGEEITARIIRIDPEKKQIGLSLKQVTSDRYMDSDLAWDEATFFSDEEE